MNEGIHFMKIITMREDTVDRFLLAFVGGLLPAKSGKPSGTSAGDETFSLFGVKQFFEIVGHRFDDLHLLSLNVCGALN